jgi:hypothetical protein
MHATYELREVGEPTLADVLEPVLQQIPDAVALY